MTRRATPFQFHSRTSHPPRPLSLSDDQLQTVMLAAGPLPPEKRAVLLERVGAALRRGDSGSIDVVVQRALRGLHQEAL